MRSNWPAAALALVSAAAACGQNVPGVTYVDQPKGVPLAMYVAAWPGLEAYAPDLRQAHTPEVRKKLRARLAEKDVSDGELNLSAQLEWQHGDLAAADSAIARAIAMRPKHPLHSFQEAMVCFAHLRQSQGMWDRWTWQRRTRDAYERTFALDPRNISARYYLAYSYLNTPAIGGGDSAKALQLAEGGVALGQQEFYPVRADAHRVRGEKAAAIADYGQSIALRVIKLGGFLEAAAEALNTGEKERAKKYLDWSVYCRADAAGPYEGLGDYYASVGDIAQARRNYTLAITKDAARNKDAARSSAQKKLERLGKAAR